MHAMASLEARILEWRAPRGKTREGVELFRAPQAAWWGVVLGGTDGKCRIAETGNFPYSPAFYHATIPPSLFFTTSSVCYGLCLVVKSELFLRSEKRSAAKPVCWHHASVCVTGTQPAPAQFHRSERD